MRRLYATSGMPRSAPSSCSEGGASDQRADGMRKSRCGVAGSSSVCQSRSVGADRLRALARLDARVTVAVDSDETIDAAATAGVAEVLIDVNVGMPRCGCAPDAAGRLADVARARGLAVRGVMGYEGHVVGLHDRATRVEQTETAMRQLLDAHADVGGDLVSGGGTGTFDINTWVTEI